MAWLKTDTDDLDLRIQEIFNEAFQVLELKSGGSVQEDLDLATNNLAKMYELDAPSILLRKAHSVQRQRLNNFREWTRNNRDLAREAPNERRQELTLIQGDKH